MCALKRRLHKAATCDQDWKLRTACPTFDVGGYLVATCLHHWNRCMQQIFKTGGAGSRIVLTTSGNDLAKNKKCKNFSLPPSPRSHMLLPYLELVNKRRSSIFAK